MAIGVATLVVLLGATLFGAILLVENGGAKGLLQTAVFAKVHRSGGFASYRAKLLSADPTIVLKDFVVASPPEISREDLLRAQSVTLHLRPGGLWRGRVDLRSIAIDHGQLHLVRLGPGRNNYTFGHGGSGGLLRSVQSLTVSNSIWRIDDPDRHIFLAGALRYGEGPYPLVLQAAGNISEQPADVVLQGGALHGRQPNAAWPLDIVMDDGKATLHLKGATQAPFDFGGFDFDVQSQGPNLAVLGWILRTEVPNSPAYHLTVRASRRDHTVRLTGLRATVGDSDVAGDITSDHSNPRRKITADLSFATLHAGDLAVLASPPAPHGQARSEPGAAAASGGGLGMAKPFPVAGIRKMDADLHLKADRVEGYGLPLRQLDLALTLNDGRLEAKPIAFLMPSGGMTARLTLDARGTAPVGSIDMTAHSERLSDLRPQMRSQADGEVKVAIAMTSTGASPKAMLADASGRAVLFGRGRLRRAAAAALSGDSLKAVAAGVGGPAAMDPVECLFGQFQATHGVLTSDSLKVVTPSGYSEGAVRIGLADGHIDLRLQGRPFRRFAGASPPILVTGDVAHPKLTVDKGAVVAGAALSALTSPVAMLAPRNDDAATRCRGAESANAAYLRGR